MPSSRSSALSQAETQLALSSADVSRRQLEFAELDRVFEAARTRRHEAAVRLREAREIRERWAQAVSKARCPRIGKVEA